MEKTLDYYILVGFRLRDKLAHWQVRLCGGSYLVGFLSVSQRFFFLGTPFFLATGFPMVRVLTAWISYRVYRVCLVGFYYSGVVGGPLY